MRHFENILAGTVCKKEIGYLYIINRLYYIDIYVFQDNIRNKLRGLEKLLNVLKDRDVLESVEPYLANLIPILVTAHQQPLSKLPAQVSKLSLRFYRIISNTITIWNLY